MKDMKIVIMQPTYLPWLGYFELMSNCDLFVLMDDVQFIKKSWHSRNRIKTSSGELLLSVPVFSKGKRCQQIRDAEINNDLPWRKKHFSAIENSYKKARFFNDYFKELEEIYSGNHSKLLDLNIKLIEFIKEKIGISTVLILASTLNASGVKSEKVVNICKKLNADILYDAQGAKDVLDLNFFKDNKIKLIFQEYEHPVYTQLHGDFIPYLSAIDLLLNEGKRSMEIIVSGRKISG